MPQVIDTDEEIALHKTHTGKPQPETCDLCWMEVPFTSKEIAEIEESFNDVVPWD